jgi:hypothetical protein
MRRILLVVLYAASTSLSAMTMQPIDDVWVIDFLAHPDNEVLWVAVECRKGDGLWKQGIVHDIDPVDTHIRLRRPTTPEGYSCSAVGMIMRNPSHDHQSDHQTIGESTLILL